MRTRLLTTSALCGFALLADAASATTAAAQARQRGGNACVSPMPLPVMGGRGFGGMAAPGGRGGRGGAWAGRAAGADSTAPRGAGRGGFGARRAGCPPYFPDSLALTASQSQQIAALHASFQQANAPALAQLRAISDSARAARSAGATSDQYRAIQAASKPITDALRVRSQQMQGQVVALLNAGQLAWMKAYQPNRRPARNRRPGRR